MSINYKINPYVNSYEVDLALKGKSGYYNNIFIIDNNSKECFDIAHDAPEWVKPTSGRMYKHVCTSCGNAQYVLPDDLFINLQIKT